MLEVTNEIDLGEERTEKLIDLLRRVEAAESGDEAVWLGEEDRELIGEIRNEIEQQTGRN